MIKFKSISILGAGGHGRSVYSWLQKSNISYDQIQFIDPYKKNDKEKLFNQLILKREWNSITSIMSDAFLIAVGKNDLRKYIYQKLEAGAKNIIGITHNSSILGCDAIIHQTVIIGPNTIIGPVANIGANSIINSGAIIEHECIIGEHTHIAPGVKVAGRVRIGDKTFIGIGAVIKENIKIGKNVTVGAGAVVINDVPDNAVVVGVPAKIIRFE